MRLLAVATALGMAATLACGCQRQAHPLSEGPEALKVRVLKEYPHDPNAFTQGLVWYRGKIFESTGLYVRSGVRRVDPQTGNVEASGRLPDDMFGEGLALVHRELIQLTWENGKALFWDLMTLRLLRQVEYEGEGWGLCFDGGRLIMSDGSDRLTFRDSKTFSVLGEVKVRKMGIPVRHLNELECVEGMVYANVWQHDHIARIDPATGEVTGWVDAGGLLNNSDRRGVDVLNGIAYVPERKRFLLTGKNWPKLFEVEFVPDEQERPQ